MEPVRILLSDDHVIVRNGLKQMLRRHSQFKVVAEASSGVEAINYLEQNHQQIDVVLMDISMPDMNGIEATKIISDTFKTLKC